ncbi:MAG: fibrobacter succinogenes major paralogous domain-containing protein [Bacteroidota bacterium]|nr:fibrobacter succinogenes major paralogous domain-containing protein [Bacteroidota bacterium]
MLKLFFLLIINIIFSVNSFSQNKGTFTDPRDKKLYKTITIGKQTWMAQNLNYTTASDSWCYENDPKNCNVYGRLYNWYIIMQGAKSNNTIPGKVRGICPVGWHIPSDAEWDILAHYLGEKEIAGSKMKEPGIKWWTNPNVGATNISGFSGLPGGGRYVDGSFIYIGTNATFWSSTEKDAAKAYYRYLYHSSTELKRYYSKKSIGFSVRCIKG